MKNRINFINQVDEFGYMKRETTTTEETDHDADIQQEIKETSFSCVQYSDRYVGPCSSTDNRNQSDSTQEIEAGQSVSTRNLLSWSFQIARGMGYLASKKALSLFPWTEHHSKFIFCPGSPRRLGRSKCFVGGQRSCKSGWFWYGSQNVL